MVFVSGGLNRDLAIVLNACLCLSVPAKGVWPLCLSVSVKPMWDLCLSVSAGSFASELSSDKGIYNLWGYIYLFVSSQKMMYNPTEHVRDQFSNQINGNP